MPRPGPRPYECVRRAWHSDRHQPMRGSIIQQIFRLVHETHSKPTKKNREWQEKLPIVVLKAEEIMYSKANSEAEYMNLDTLWDRVNDAVNTIIRKDESTETGELLPPCVEAALNLGCFPVRASRSQRHSNPRCYLSPRLQETGSASPRVSEKNDDRCPQLSPLHSGNQLNFERAMTTLNSSIPASEANCHLRENSTAAAPHTDPFLYENIPPGSNQLMTKETDMQLNFGSVYPLYYGNKYQIEEPQFVFQIPETTDTTDIFVGRPIGPAVAEPIEMGVFQNFLPCSSTEVASRRITQPNFKNTYENSPGMICDLSLRLGMFSDPGVNMGKSTAQEAEDVGSSSSRDGGKFRDPSSEANKEFCFFPGTSTNDPSESRSIKWISENEDHNFKSTFRKRKTPFSDNVEDEKFC